MADFKRALRALSEGTIPHAALAERIESVLTRRPHSAGGMLDDLKESLQDQVIDRDTYQRLRELVLERAEASEATRFETSALPADPDTNSSWDDDPTSVSRAAPPPGAEPKLAPGTILKGRFQLDEVLGTGGMGIVYKGRDLIKVEAQDRNPYVALKVLNEDFKQHPQSFIALQREASRQQRLAHPNVATVYDFDRTSGGTVFLTMELLEGTPLNEFIKNELRDHGGLPFMRAFPMIEGLGKALIYAHEHNIVHSDFKPANCFITKDGTMKVLDFGIARAVKTHGEGDKTLFDAGKLGALTPAYASVEQLQEQEPDPRDDLFALACVAYELLSGRHPFNKVRADAARDHKLTPAPIKGLSRRQMRALARGLAFERADRTQSVAEFLRELQGSRSALRNPAIVIPVGIAVLALAGAYPALSYLHERAIGQRIAAANSGESAAVERVLDELPALEEADRNRILTASREPILDYFEGRVRAAVDPKLSRYDFTGAGSVMERANAIDAFRDSSRLNDLNVWLAEQRAARLNDLTTRFNALLESGALLPDEASDDIHDVLADVREVDAEYPLLRDARLPGAFGDAVTSALASGDFAGAGRLAATGLTLLPGNDHLVNLADKVTATEEQTKRGAEIARLSSAIAEAGFEGIEDLLALEPNIVALAHADSAHPMLEDLARRALSLIAPLLARGAAGDNPLLGADHGPLLQALGLRQQAFELARLRDDLNARLTPAIIAVARAAAASDAAEVEAQLTALDALAPTSGRVRRAHELAERAARRRSAPAASASSSPDFDARSAEIHEQLPALTTPEALLAAAAGFDALASLRPADPSLPELRELLTERVQATAESLRSGGDWQRAFDLAEQALVYLPDATSLAEVLMSLEAGRADATAREQERFVAQRRETVAALLADARFDRAWHASMWNAVSDIAGVAAADDAWLNETRGELTERYLARAQLMADALRFAEAVNLIEYAARYAPGDPRLRVTRERIAAGERAFDAAEQARRGLARVESLKQTFRAQTAARQVSAAAATLALLREELGDADPFVSDAVPALALAYSKAASARAQAGDFAQALSLARAGYAIAPQSPELQQQVRDYNVRGTQQAIDNQFAQGGEPDWLALLEQIEQLKQLDPVEYSRDQERWAQSVARSLQALAQDNKPVFNEVLSRAQTVFAGNQLLASLEPVTVDAPSSSIFAGAIENAIDAALLNQARELLTKASESEAGHPDIVRLKGVYNARLRAARALYEDYKTAFSTGDYRRADNVIDRALAMWKDSGTFQQEKTRVVAALEPAGGVERTTALLPPPPSQHPCTSDLAGHGERRTGACYDMIAAGARGPVMVVVPAGGAFTAPFAIGKYEVAVSDYNNYCKLSGACAPVDGRGSAMPVTGISVDNVRTYADWLTQRTGHRYRLPAVDEWAYAASAAGEQPRKDYNCRLEQGGQVLKGHALMDVNAGETNGWGLHHYVGNAQEWAYRADALVARGGEFGDAFSKCAIEFERPHPGTPDGATGFRLVMEMQ